MSKDLLDTQLEEAFDPALKSLLMEERTKEEQKALIQALKDTMVDWVEEMRGRGIEPTRAALRTALLTLIPLLEEMSSPPAPSDATLNFYFLALYQAHRGGHGL